LALLAKKFSHLEDVPTELYDLESEYEDLKRHTAWLHFYTKLDTIKQDLERQILRGVTDGKGEDLTPYIRASYGTLLQVMAVPQTIKALRQQAEYVIMGKIPERQMADKLAPPNLTDEEF